MMLDMGTAAQDSDQGSSAALTQLEKGLRSPKLGEQSEAIVKFPRLFERYPFPVLINTALLKLAEVFRQGSNFLKLCVLRVCQAGVVFLCLILPGQNFFVFVGLGENQIKEQVILLEL